MTEISIYGKYKVKCEQTYSEITDKVGDEYFFDTGKNTFTATVDGSALIDWISYSLRRSHFSSVSFAGNDCIIEYFNPDNGESETMHYSWEETKEVKEVKEEQNNKTNREDSLYITNKDGCTWCDGVGNSPKGHFCGECDCIDKDTCPVRELEKGRGAWVV